MNIELPKMQHRYVVGRRWEGLQRILLETGVSVEVPPPDDETTTVVLRGEASAIGAALTKVYTLVPDTIAFHYRF